MSVDIKPLQGGVGGCGHVWNLLICWRSSLHKRDSFKVLPLYIESQKLGSLEQKEIFLPKTANFMLS